MLHRTRLIVEEVVAGEEIVPGRKQRPGDDTRQAEMYQITNPGPSSTSEGEFYSLHHYFAYFSLVHIITQHGHE